jgi:hypothetical protein
VCLIAGHEGHPFHGEKEVEVEVPLPVRGKLILPAQGKLVANALRRALVVS